LTTEKTFEKDKQMDYMTPWGPFRRLVGLRDRMEQLTQPWPGFHGLASEEEESLRRGWVPPVDVRETPHVIEVTAELPGIDPADVDVSVQGNVLTIRGERSYEEAKEDETLHRIERNYGRFERSFTLPRSVNYERIGASFKDGVLTVQVPKREEAKPKAIKIDIDTSS